MSLLQIALKDTSTDLRPYLYAALILPVVADDLHGRLVEFDYAFFLKLLDGLDDSYGRQWHKKSAERVSMDIAYERTSERFLLWREIS